MNRLFSSFDKILFVAMLVILGIVLAAFFLDKTFSSKYIYSARGVICEEFDKDSNTLKNCDAGSLGKVEIINPISILKIKVD